MDQTSRPLPMPKSTAPVTLRGSRSSCKPCSFINERQLGVDTDFVSVASKARGHSHQKTKIIFFVGCLQTKKCMRSLSPCRDLAMSCGGPAQQYARICDRRLVTVLSLVPGLCVLQKGKENEAKNNKIMNPAEQKKEEEHGGREE